MWYERKNQPMTWIKWSVHHALANIRLINKTENKYIMSNKDSNHIMGLILEAVDKEINHLGNVKGLLILLCIASEWKDIERLIGEKCNKHFNACEGN